MRLPLRCLLPWGRQAVPLQRNGKPFGADSPAAYGLCALCASDTSWTIYKLTCLPAAGHI